MQKEMKMKNRKIDEKSTKQVVIDKELHKMVKIEATKSDMTIRELVENALAEYLYVNNTEK